MDILDKSIVLFVLLMLSLVAIEYYGQQATNDIKSEIFGNITNTTTNHEIVGYIHNACSQTPWYVLKVDCESSMLRTFIIESR